MERQQSILLVEGEADRLFFEHLCRTHRINTIVKVHSPRDIKGTYNTKGAVFNVAPILLDQMLDGRLINFAIVIDADHPQYGGGQDATLVRIAALLSVHGFTQRQRVGEHGGYRFEHNDGLTPVGVWIMPDNLANGSIEDFIKMCVCADQKQRYAESAKALASSTRPFAFREAHYLKAEIATWLAWQEVPGQGIFSCIRNNLIDAEAQPFKRLIAWLRHSYP